MMRIELEECLVKNTVGAGDGLEKPVCQEGKWLEEWSFVPLMMRHEKGFLFKIYCPISLNFAVWIPEMTIP